MSTPAACSKPMAASSNGLWQGDDPLKFALPLLVLQICLVLAVSRVLAVLFKPLGQPRVIAEIIGGILLGPSVLGRYTVFIDNVFPKQSITVLDTVANFGLIFFLFLVGLELDLQAILKAGKPTLAIAGAGITIPFAAGIGVSLVLHKTIASDARFLPFVVFMGVAVAITAFPVLARILAERKMLTTDVGQMAMSAAAVNDLVAWILLALAVALSSSGKSALVAVWVLLSGIAFLLVMFFVIKPLMSFIARRAEGNKPINELHVAVTLAGVLAAGFSTDAIGIHAIFGAFVFGLIIPKEGPFAGMLVEKLEDLVTTLLLPLYFASSGLKTNIGAIHTAQSVGLLFLIIMTACVGKIFGTFGMALLFKITVRKSLALGFLMNTKGLVELIVLNIGKDRKVLNDETFAMMVLMAIVTTIIATPAVMLLYKPARNPVPYSRRRLYLPGIKSDAELRVLACVHGMPNVHAIINLVEASRGTRKKPLGLYILHLLELTERPSSYMSLQRVQLRKGSNVCMDNDSVVLAFEAFGQLSKVNVQAMTALSNFQNMHEDICASASEKRAAFVLLPFHKQAFRPDGAWEGNSPGLRNVNQKVLLHAPCSVGILVDRGIGLVSFTSNRIDHNVAVLFFGGPDCREALAFGLRMAEHPGVKLKVFRFLFNQSKDHSAIIVSIDEDHVNDESGAHSMNSRFAKKLETQGSLSNFHHARDESGMCSKAHGSTAMSGNDIGEECRLDEDCLAMVKERVSCSSETRRASGSVSYEEREVATIASMEIGMMKTLNLVIVGRGRSPSPLVATLANERQVMFSELGAVGDMLLMQCHDTKNSSILVIQQHDPALQKEEHFTLRSDASFTKSNGLLSRNLLIATGSPLPTSSTPSSSSPST